MPDDSPDPPPFIPTQRLFHLTAPARERAKWLEPPWFNLRRRWGQNTNRLTPAARQRKRTSSEQPALHWDDADLALQLGQPAWAWDEVLDRERFLTDPNLRLLCVVDDAGRGKTKTLEQTAYLRMALDPAGHLAIKVEFADLPLRVDHYIGRTPKQAAAMPKEPLLMARLHALAQTQSMPTAAAWELLQRKARRGQLTLLVDALDQTNVGRDDWQARDAAQILGDFLVVFPKVRCVVSGRPFAVEFYRETLFARSDWHFAQLDAFSPKEETVFLGPERVAAIKNLEFRSGAVPRDLETIRELTPQELQGVRTQAELYARLVDRMPRKGREKQKIPISGDRAAKLLALLAFEMDSTNQTAGIGNEFGEMSQRDPDVAGFVRRIWQARGEVLSREEGYRSVEDLHEDLGRLAALNIALDPGVLAVPYKSDLHAPQLTWLKWRNRTLQDYFAALWLSKYSSTPAERHWLREHRHVRGEDMDHHSHAELYEFWRFLAEMPPEQSDAGTWVASLSGLYLVDRGSPPAPRSSEMLYRSWRGMLRRGGLLSREQVTEPSVMEATARLQRSVLGECRNGKRAGGVALAMDDTLPNDSRQAARHCLEQYLAEFPAMCLEARPRHGAWRDVKRKWFTGKRLAAEIGREYHETWFRAVPAGKFWMGAEGEHDEPVHIGELPKPMHLAQYPLTNELLAMYAPRHTEPFEHYQGYSGQPRCPAIYVNWYDAWSVAVWLHARLPDEYEWEGACRAQFWQGTAPPPRATAYWFGDSAKELHQHAWYSRNAVSCGHEVGAAGHANGLGLSDMHGNVWEWTSSWYHEDPRSARDHIDTGVSRVLRGGAFHVNAIDCRSAYRNHWQPWFNYYSVGVRLARDE